jgi:hypothetical protein
MGMQVKLHFQHFGSICCFFYHGRKVGSVGERHRKGRKNRSRLSKGQWGLAVHKNGCFAEVATGKKYKRGSGVRRGGNNYFIFFLYFARIVLAPVFSPCISCTIFPLDPEGRDSRFI